MKKVILTGLAAVMMSSAALASEVTAGVDTTQFSANTAARATEVNGNFSALIGAINDNNSRIAALEAASGGTTDLQSIVSGATYKLFYMGGLMTNFSDAASPYRQSTIEHFGGYDDLTFNADGTVTTVINEAWRTLNLEKEHNCDANNSCEHESFTGEDLNLVEGPGGMWSLSGQTLTLLWPGDVAGDEEEFMLSADGGMLVLGGYDRFVDTDQFGTNDEMETFLAVGIKLPAAL